MPDRSSRVPARQDERGAVALLAALLAVVLFGVGAMAVDIGQAYAKRSMLQTDVDVAVMAAAAKLDNAGGCNPEVVSTAVEFLSKAENAVPGQFPLNLGGTAGDQDGFIRCQNWRVELWAPRSHVAFGLGKVVSDQDGVDVAAHAVAQIKAAGGNATLPFFSATGCDYGPQSIRNDSAVATTPPVPPLDPDTALHNDAVFTISPANVPTGTSSASITVSGTKLRGATAIGFTGAAGPPYHYEVPITPVTGNGAVSFPVPVPSDVLGVEDVWYVRVFADGEWSDPQQAQSFTVGPPKLYCDAANEGNFGTIDLPRTDTASFPLEWNMIKGLEPTLAIHPSPNGECSGQPGSVESTTAPVDGTNCIATEPGLKIAETNAGLVTGKGGLPGRLDADSTSNCSRNHDSGRTVATVKGVHVNDDLLSCFITNGAQLSDLVAGDSVATQALSSDIFRSPRFFRLPVLDTRPSTGKKSWPIVDFRPGFITDQSLSATHDAPGTISDLNGLVSDSSGIREVRVVLFDEKSLPEFAPATGGEADYTGSGPKVIVLVE